MIEILDALFCNGDSQCCDQSKLDCESYLSFDAGLAQYIDEAKERVQLLSLLWMPGK